MTNNLSKEDITSYKQAKKCAYNDMKMKEKLISKQLDDEVFFQLLKSNKNENKKANAVYDSNVVSSNAINEFHKQLQHD